MSQAQDDWLSICAAVRAGLAEQVKQAATLAPADLAVLVDAIDLAIAHAQGVLSMDIIFIGETGQYARPAAEADTLCDDLRQRFGNSPWRFYLERPRAQSNWEDTPTWVPDPEATQTLLDRWTAERRVVRLLNPDEVRAGQPPLVLLTEEPPVTRQPAAWTGAGLGGQRRGSIKPGRSQEGGNRFRG